MEYVMNRALDAKAKSLNVYNIAKSGNPDALRSSLVVLFSPGFQPTFTEPKKFLHSAALDPPSSQTTQQTSVPVRMFDIDTGHLVERPDIGDLDQYCMLSHSWKGNEVTYSYISRARELDIDLAKKAKTDQQAKSDTSASDAQTSLRKSDVQMIKEQCKKDVREQKETIEALTVDIDSELGIQDRSDIVGFLLEKRIRAKDAEYRLSRATKEKKAALQRVDYSAREASNIKDMVSRIVPKEGILTVEGQNIPVEEPNTKDTEVTKAEAVRAFDEAKQNYDNIESNVIFFQKHSRIREAVDAMEGCLQQWRSSIKIEQSMRQAKEVFDKKLFIQGGKRYIWLDTCCINKANSGELVESLSLMGDWYANADCCLVHLDTRRSGEEWIQAWQAFKEEGSSYKAPNPNVSSFKEILSSEPEWATRGWTLQEAVLSKTTFYVNSSWNRLARPVESIGPYYYFCPFIDLYLKKVVENPDASTKNIRHLTMPSTLARIFSRAKVEFPYGSAEDFIESAYVESTGIKIKDNGTHRNIDDSYVIIDSDGEGTKEDKGTNDDKSEIIAISVAQKLIVLLESLGVQLSKDIDKETAKSRITETIRVAAAGCSEDSKMNILSAIKAEVTLSSSHSVAVDLLNLLLQCLVRVTKDLVQRDRKYIADFNKLQELNTWVDGTARDKFSTRQVMSLACERQCTVETDQAYSLMGILGVRFPTFHAEGLTKALSRLLDEVIIMSNDISVFNWTGKEFGSPIRGRSLYPSKLQAYKLQGDEERKNKKLKELTEPFQIRRHEMSDTFVKVAMMLQEAIKYIKDKKHNYIRIDWVLAILNVVKEVEFSVLKTHLENIAKILIYLQHEADTKEKKVAEEEALRRAAKSEKSEKSETGFNPFNIASSLSTSLPLDPKNFAIPKMSLMKSKPESPVATPESSKSIGSMKGLGGFKSPMGKGFGFGRGSSKPEPASSPSPPLSQAPTLTAEVPEPPQQEPAGESKPDSHPTQSEEDASNSLDSHVKRYIASIPLPKVIKKSVTEQAAEALSEGQLSPGLVESVRSAFIVQTGGYGAKVVSPPVEAPVEPVEEVPAPVLDLPDELKGILALIETPAFVKPSAQLDNGTTISPNPIIVNNSGIEGVFDIQRVIITMLDPDSLYRQIKEAASPQQRISGWCMISTGFAVVMVSFSCEAHMLERQLDVVSAVESKVLKEQHDDRLQRRATGLPGSPPPTGKKLPEKPEGAQENGSPETEDDMGESEKVVRMINFVQEQDLNKVAGEWVLARFSGVPTAKWFLCSLELGPTNDYYGYRIPTDEIDFHNASPELGLTSAWEKYMMRKKRKLSGILITYLNARNSEHWGEDAAAGAAAFFTDKSNKDASGKDEKGGDGEEDSDDEDKLDVFFAQGKDLLYKLGGALFHQFLEMRAEYLEKHLSASVLKKTPPHMRAALEHLNDNKDMLPSMFHSGKKMHMF
ncbi:hypothetical protein F5884DRAFT_878223 [Xylogone sp. PMI_703]|nr:hypothetical protein F5884DRAFT_878223 [Xylogone sp. PMI_703]